MSRLATASGDELLALALETPGDKLGELLDNEALTEAQLMAVLRRRDISSRFLQRVADDRGWAGKYLIKALIVMNPHTPKPVSMNLVKFLFWRDLVKVIANFGLEPPVRVTAEKVLKDRLDEMVLGEKIALARLGSREVVKMMRKQRNEMVFDALLQNPRLTEEDLLPMATDSRTPANLLSLIARSAKWNTRYPIRLALVRNTSTPNAVALSQLITLTPTDLRDLTVNPSVARSIRQAAGRVLQTKGRRAGRSPRP